MIHSDECTRRVQATLRQRAAYMERWPKYCRACDGIGVIHDSYRVDDSGYQFDSIDPCEQCTDRGICPRCGHSHGYLFIDWLGVRIGILGYRILRPAQRWMIKLPYPPRSHQTPRDKTIRIAFRIVDRARAIGEWFRDRGDALRDIHATAIDPFTGQAHPCPFCGWNWGNNPGDILPAIDSFPCECEITDWQARDLEDWYGGN